MGEFFEKILEDGVKLFAKGSKGLPLGVQKALETGPLTFFSKNQEGEEEVTQWIVRESQPFNYFFPESIFY